MYSLDGIAPAELHQNKFYIILLYGLLHTGNSVELLAYVHQAAKVVQKYLGVWKVLFNFVYSILRCLWGL